VSEKSADCKSRSAIAHLIALAATLLTWPLLLVGGSVTVFRVGMAVPDWPTTFGINMFVYRFWEASWGVFIEHGHRLYGALVGLACVILVVWFALFERRPWMRTLAAFALVAVIVQGILGGLRVTRNSPNLAFVHGITAQGFFGLMVVLCVLTGRVATAPVVDLADNQQLRRRSAVTLGMVYLQIVLGAWLRHFGAALVLHALAALAVWSHVVVLVRRVGRVRHEAPELLPAARALGLLTALQFLLGVGAWAVLRPFDGIPREVTTVQAVVRIGHQGLGALVLAAATVLTLRAFRRYGSPTRAVASSSGLVGLEAAR
jgi:cytochrome c oxidase assembly protein subunit 15